MQAAKSEIRLTFVYSHLVYCSKMSTGSRHFGLVDQMEVDVLEVDILKLDIMALICYSWDK